VTATPRVYGVLVTFRRPVELALSLTSIANQTRPLEQLVVVDNDGSAEAVVREHAPGAIYLRAGENLGPAGGIALGMERVLETAGADDWVFTFDDDDWSSDRNLFARLVGFAETMRQRDPVTAGIGRSGTRFDCRTGMIVRVRDDELRGPVPVDAVAGNQFPLYSVAAIRATGPFRADLFFGFEELEFGLRLNTNGYHLYVDGAEWHAGRERSNRLDLIVKPSRSLRDEPHWERYYSLRNLIWILRSQGHRGAAVRVTVITGVGKPLANFLRAPGLALRHLRQGLRASRDGWLGRMGRTIEP
jgi:GT2 family glycosyltransferase